MDAGQVLLCGRALRPVVLGTASLGSVLPDALVLRSARERAYTLLDGMLEAGCTAIDTAASYMLGGTERLLGGWLASRGHRERCFLITKGCHPVPVVRPHRLTPRDIDDDLHASLRRLRTERVDLYLLHRDDPGAPLPPVVEALSRHQRDGKIGAWGVSNWTTERFQAVDAVAREAGVPGPAASSPQFSLVSWTAPPWTGSVSLSGDEGRPGRAFHAKAGLPVLAWSPLGNGFFAPGAGGSGPYQSPENVARRDRARELGNRLGRTAAQIALAYLFRQPFPVLAVVGASRVAHMQKNLEAATIALSDGDVAWLETGERAPLP